MGRRKTSSRAVHCRPDALSAKSTTISVEISNNNSPASTNRANEFHEFWDSQNPICITPSSNERRNTSQRAHAISVSIHTFSLGYRIAAQIGLVFIFCDFQTAIGKRKSNERTVQSGPLNRTGVRSNFGPKRQLYHNQIIHLAAQRQSNHQGFW